MKINIKFKDSKPLLAIYALEGVLLNLYGRTSYIVSVNPMDDDLSTWFMFYFEPRGETWQFSYKSNCKYIRAEDQQILDNLLVKANRAIEQQQSTDLTQEFDALDQREPFGLGGLYSQMTERHVPIYKHRDPNQEIDAMRDILRANMSPEEINTDSHLKSFILRIPMPRTVVDLTPQLKHGE